MVFWGNVAASLVANILFIPIAIFLGWIILHFNRRRHLLRFFSINIHRRLVIYLSDLRLESGQTFGVDEKRRMYTGSAVAFGEMQSANKFRDLFNYFLPSLSEAPNFLSKLLISDVQTQIQRSPSSKEQVEKSTSFIAFGSPAYNFASRYVEESLHSKAKFILGKSLIPAPSYPDKSIKPVGVTDYNRSSLPTGTSVVPDEAQIITSASPDEAIMPSPLGDKQSESVTPTESPTFISVEDIKEPFMESTYGFVERIVDHKQERFVFYVAGISELSTVGAGNYLITEWGELQRKYGNDKSFLVMLNFDSTDHRRWNILFEK